MKTFFLRWVKAIVLVFLISLLFLGLMIFVYSLPTGRMFAHVKESEDIFCSSSISVWTPGVDSAILSYPTDAIMYNCAIYGENKKGSIFNALMNPRYENGKGRPEESLYKALQYGNADAIKTSRSAVTEIDTSSDEKNINGEIETMYYPRYWHGYLLVLKPLLLFFNVSEIKMMSILVQIILIAVTLYLIREKLGIGVAAAFLSMIVILNPVTLVLTISKTIVFVILLVACDLVLLLNEKFIGNGDKYFLFFLALGAVTCFLDFLTYPLVSLGIPLALFLMLNYQKADVLKDLVSNSFSWSFGYAGVWICKFLYCSLLTNYNAVEAGMESVAFRLGVGETSDNFDTSVLSAIMKNVEVLMTWQTVEICIIIAIACVILIIKGYHCQIHGKIWLGLLLIAAYPFIWFAALSNHSTIHYYFTYRELAISWFCVFSGLLYNWEKANNIVSTKFGDN